MIQQGNNNTIQDQIISNNSEDTRQLARQLNQAPTSELRQTALDIIERFAGNNLKDESIITEVLALSDVDDKDITQHLLKQFSQPIKDNALFTPALLKGLAHIIQHANPAYLEATHLSQILSQLNTSQDQLFPTDIVGKKAILSAIVRLLNAMVTTGIEKLPRVEKYNPLHAKLKSFSKDADFDIAFLAAYACQALAHIGDDESRLQCILRHGLNVGKGAANIFGALASIDIKKLEEGLTQFMDVGKGVLSGVSNLNNFTGIKEEATNANKSVSNAIVPVSTVKIEQGVNQVKEGLNRTTRAATWYEECRYAELLLSHDAIDLFIKLVEQSNNCKEKLFVKGIIYFLKDKIFHAAYDNVKISSLTFLVELSLSDDKEIRLSRNNKSYDLSLNGNKKIKFNTDDNIQKQILHIFSHTARHSSPEMKKIVIKYLDFLHFRDSELFANEVGDINSLLSCQLAFNENEEKSQQHFPRKLISAIRKEQDNNKTIDQIRLISEKINNNINETQMNLNAVQINSTKEVDALLERRRNYVLLEAEKIPNEQTENNSLRDNIGDLRLYTPLMGKVSLEDKKVINLEEDVKDFLNGKESVYLLLSDSGTGKTLFFRHLESEYWKQFESKNIIPLFIPLIDSGGDVKDLIKKAWQRCGFTNNEIDLLKSSRRSFLFILDGFDEIRGKSNLVTSALQGWENAKVLVSCRRDYALQLGDDYKRYFHLIIHEKRQGLRERYIAPFDKDKIGQYLNKYISYYTLPSGWSNGKQYMTYLKEFPLLHDLVDSPLMLAIVASVLPGLVEKYGDGADFAKLTRSALYDAFFDQWFTRQINKLILQPNRLQLTKDELFAFTRELAEAMWQLNGQNYLEYQSDDEATEVKATLWNPLSLAATIVNEVKKRLYKPVDRKKFFATDERTITLRQACPLLFNENSCRFVHDSLWEYLARRASFDALSEAIHILRPKEYVNQQAQDIQKLKDIHLKAPNSVSVDHYLENQSTLVEQEIPLQLSARLAEFIVKEHNFNARLLIDIPAMIKGWVELQKNNSDLKNILYEVIAASRNEPRISNAAANAITILNASDENFSGKNFSNVNIRGANLDNGIFDHTNFKGADLRDVSFRGAWLRGVDFSGVNMAGVIFGEQPYLKLSNEVTCLTYSANGLWLAVGFGNNINLYETNTYQWSHTLRGYPATDIVTSLAFGSDNLLASASLDGIVILWDAVNRQKLTLFDIRGVRLLAFGPQDLLAICSDQVIQLWNVGRPHNIYKEMWDIKRKKRICVFKEHKDSIKSLSFGSDNLLVSASNEGTVNLWNIQENKLFYTLKLFYVFTLVEKGVVAVFGPNNLLAIGYNNTMQLWNAKEKKLLSILKVGKIENMSFVSDNLIVISSGKSLQLWNIQNEQKICNFEGHVKQITSMCFGPDGLLTSGSQDGTVRRWIMKSAPSLRIFKCLHRNNIRNIVFGLPDLLVSASADEINLWDMKEKEWLREFKVIVRTNVAFNAVDLLAYGTSYATISLRNIKTEEIWDVKIDTKQDYLYTFIEETQREYQGASFSSLHFMSDSLLVIALEERSYYGGVWIKNDVVVLYDLKSKKFSRLFVEDGIISIVCNQENSLIACSSYPNRLGIYNLKDKQFVVCRTLKQPEGLTFGPENFLAANTTDLNICLWEVKSGRIESVHFFNAQSCISSLSLGPTGLLASGHIDAVIRLWDVKSQKCLATITNFPNKVSSIAWQQDNDGVYLVTSSDKEIRCWQIIQQEKAVKVVLHWSSSSYQESLAVADANVAGASLETTNITLLQQRGAVGYPMQVLTGKNNFFLASVEAKKEEQQTQSKSNVHNISPKSNNSSSSSPAFFKTATNNQEQGNIIRQNNVHVVPNTSGL